MGKIRTLDQAWASVRSESRPSIEEISNTTGIPESTLYRKLSPTDPDIRVKDSEIAPILNAAGRFDPLDVICHSCGGVFVRLRMGRRSAPESADYQIRFQGMFKSLLEFEKDPTQKNAYKFISEASQHVRDTVALQKKVENHSDQIDIEFDE